MTLYLHNTLTRKKDEFTPLDPKNVRMYVCGPTVYGRAHLGNARSVVVYDVLYRLLRHIYGSEHVTYARNITDVDDKINAAAKERGITIKQLTTEVTEWFHSDMAELGVLPATESKSNGLMIEPKATDHIAQMIAMIERLISNGKAYVAAGHVLFSVKSLKEYGRLSGRIQEELEAGSRVKVEAYKRDPNDFVLWKPADAEDDPSSIFESPWGNGRPGWHIECSAMSTHYLGLDFDIHGGGSDLMFPHHENEIAQAVGAHPDSHFARYWVHNGFLTVNGEKMSKSLGNFVTVRDLLDKGIKGEVIRYALLSTKYSEPLDWSEKLVEDAKKALNYFYGVVQRANLIEGEKKWAKVISREKDLDAILYDDLNIPKLIGQLFVAGQVASFAEGDRDVTGFVTKRYLNRIGLLEEDPDIWFKGSNSGDSEIQSLIDARVAAKKAKNWKEADRIRDELKSQGILLEDRPDGSTDWRRG
jgi:cysteinyl-tRNA synthetase